MGIRSLISFTMAGLLVGVATAGAQMPDPRQMSGIPMPSSDLPNASVTVRVVRGAITNNIVGQKVELLIGTRVLEADTDQNGRAEFTGLTPGSTVKAVTIVDGERLESQEFQVPEQGGMRTLLAAGVGAGPSEGTLNAPGGGPAVSAAPAVPGSVVIGGQSRFVVEFSDDAPQVYYLLEIVNANSAPVRLPGPLVFDLPSDAQGASLLEGSSPQASVKGHRLTVDGPFQPGATLVQAAYELLPSGDAREIRLKLPAALTQVSLIVSQVGGVGVSSPQLANVSASTSGGKPFLMASGPGLPAGSELALRLSGLPHRSTAPRYIALGSALFILAIGIWVAVRPDDHDAVAARRHELELRRDAALQELVRLESSRAAGVVDEARYDTRREDLMAHLERIYGELDLGPGPDYA